MVSGKYSALAGAVSREQALSNIANNLANVNTTGYKKMLMSFESILDKEKQMGDAKGINYNRVSKSVSDFTQGPIKETGNTFDLAIHKSGFFKVQGPDGVLYTRNGSFTQGPNRTLVTHEGYQVLDDGNNPISVATDSSYKISINRFGTISALDNLGNREELGRIAVVDIDDPAKLRRRDNTTFELSQGGQETLKDDPYLVPGSLEVSNVNMVGEMTRMINGHRLYETYHKVLKGYSSISEKQEDLGTIS